MRPMSSTVDGKFGQRARGHRHRRAFTGETHGDRAAETTSRSGHDRDPAFSNSLPWQYLEFIAPGPAPAGARIVRFYPDFHGAVPLK